MAVGLHRSCAGDHLFGRQSGHVSAGKQAHGTLQGHLPVEIRFKFKAGPGGSRNRALLPIRPEAT